MSITIYGIKSCNSMKKAFTKLDEINIPYEFHDYKKQGIDRESIQRWVNELGIEKVLNKRGTTWRKLTDEQKQAANENIKTAIDLLVEHTSMIKRPVIEGTYDTENVLLCGFDDAVMEAMFEK